MTDPRIEKLAKVLVDYSIDVKPGDWVVINSSIQAMPLLREVYKYTLQAGGRPTFIPDSLETLDVLLKESSQDQLEWVNPFEELMFDKADALIFLRAENNTRVLNGIDPQKQRIRQVARQGIMQRYFDRSADGSLRWVLTQFPCNAYAQDADMSLEDYEDFVYAATFCDQPDPVKCWNELKDNQQRLVDWLAGKSQITVRGPNSDLTLSIADRTFINSDGRHNMPSGEIFTSPVEDSVNGWVHFTYPAIFQGREVQGVELEFKDGQVVTAHAQKNEEFLLSMLDSDPGARYLGEFAVGANYGIQRFTRSILYDEKIGGSIHMALGAGFPECGSKNKSSIHWDLICDMRDQSEILVDGELFYKNGQFNI